MLFKIMPELQLTKRIIIIQKVSTMFKAVVIAASLASAYATGSDQMLRGNDDASYCAHDKRDVSDWT